ncbi:leucine-rich repeat domain-containing protein [Neochlamydia sp. AcF95]|uniref:leucine-rich repeat domain-containing protein n=1 Tax=Neochlamydia sp. AcF95 TaxID=2795734 RepID=UPI001BC98CCE|nr:leucine-rich repeat domain-containing protein [Neochlamydia sp. AcF95]MBS4171083.1 Uncharacterized protein [Neochlamydia sp. AcF95]
MIPSTPISSAQTDFRTIVSENIEDAVSGELMTKAVTLIPCGHIFNEDTAIQCLARNKLCPLDRQLIERYIPNYTIRHLADTAESHPLEEHKNEPSPEAVEHFLRGKENAEKGDHTLAIEALLQALQLSPTYEKAQAYLEFCLKRSSASPSSILPSSSLKSLSLPNEKDKEKLSFSTESSKERYNELLFNLLEEPQIQANAALKKMLENQLEELISQEGEELTEKEKVSYRWTKNLLGENKKVRQFALEKLQQIYQQSSPISLIPPQLSTVSIQALSSEPMVSLYNEIINFHFPYESRNLIDHAHILDQIYKIESSLSAEAKVKHIFKHLLTLAKSLSPLEFEEENKEQKAFTFANYTSYLINTNRLLLWQQLLGGKDYLNQEEIKVLPLKKKGELLKGWIKKQPLLFFPTSLNLTALGLTFLPPEIGQMSRLKYLNLSQNQLTFVPAEIGQLFQLRGLNISNNYLTALPAQIGQLSLLTGIELQQNQLTALPAAMGQLSQLRLIYLQQNQLTALPAEIGQLSQLRTLSLKQNRLTALPSEIGNLFRLETLDLQQNHLTALPAKMRQLRGLYVLDLSQNQLTTIPTEIRQLPQLEKLEISGNPL